MGELSDRAKKKGKFLRLEKGEEVIVRFIDYKFVPSQLNPDEEDVLYTLTQDVSGEGIRKYWTNASGRVMEVMDKVPKNSFIKIRRDKFMKRDGEEDKSKSVYTVTPVNEKGEDIEY